ncbi:MAG: hypothetical protein WC989_03930 [Micavibrio sp.]
MSKHESSGAFEIGVVAGPSIQAQPAAAPEENQAEGGASGQSPSSAGDYTLEEVAELAQQRHNMEQEERDNFQLFLASLKIALGPNLSLPKPAVNPDSPHFQGDIIDALYRNTFATKLLMTNALARTAFFKTPKGNEISVSRNEIAFVDKSGQVDEAGVRKAISAEDAYEMLVKAYGNKSMMPPNSIKLDNLVAGEKDIFAKAAEKLHQDFPLLPKLNILGAPKPAQDLKNAAAATQPDNASVQNAASAQDTATAAQPVNKDEAPASTERVAESDSMPSAQEALKMEIAQVNAAYKNNPDLSQDTETTPETPQDSATAAQPDNKDKALAIAEKIATRDTLLAQIEAIEKETAKREKEPGIAPDEAVKAKVKEELETFTRKAAKLHEGFDKANKAYIEPEKQTKSIIEEDFTLAGGVLRTLQRGRTARPMRETLAFVRKNKDAPAPSA